MYYLKILTLLLSIACILFLVAGLFKPWIMLWWEDVQNRKKVITLYGSLSLLFLLIYSVLNYFTSN